MARVVVTRAASQSAQLLRLLQEQGFEAIACPTISIESPSDNGVALAAACDSIADYAWVLFTSVNAVEHFFSSVACEVPSQIQFATIGEATLRALEAKKQRASFLPSVANAETFVMEFPDANSQNTRVLLPQSSRARPVLRDGLCAKGWQVEVVEAYATRFAELSDDNRARCATADVVIFTSPSTCEGYLKTVGAPSPRQRVVCIGPTTANFVRANHIDVHAVAQVADEKAVVLAVCEAVA